jgi:hypothetical protein
MSNEIFSESLAYNNIKRRAVSSRSYRVRLPPSNATSFVPGNVIQFDLPANLAGTYFNSNQCYLKFNLKNTSISDEEGAVAGSASGRLDRPGAYSIIRRLQISTAGAQLQDTDRYNVLACAMLDTDASHEWKASVGKALCGIQNTGSGEWVGGTTIADPGNIYTPIPQPQGRDYCLPLILNVLSQSTPHRFFPLFSLSPIQMRFTLDDAVNVFKETGGTPNYALSDVELVMMLTELSPSAQASVDAMTGGRYDILATSWSNSTATKGAGASSVTANLGISVSSLERVIIIHRLQAVANGQDESLTLGGRDTAGITEYSLLINSEQYPARPIRVDKLFGAEPMAELLQADHSLANFQKGNGLNGAFLASNSTVSGGNTMFFSNNPSSALYEVGYMVEASDQDTVGTLTSGGALTASNIGYFVASIELESGISDGKSSHIYSGISTLASTVQFLGKYDVSDADGAYTIDFFSNFTVLISLNMKGTGVFSVSV